MRTILALASTAAALLGLAATAAAAPPEKDTFSFSFEYVETALCPGIAITWAHEERQTFTEFAPTRWRIQRHGAAQLTANGKTVTSNFNATIFADPRTTVERVVGTVFNIQAPGVGKLLVDAGNIVYDYSTSPPTVLHVGGRHPAFDGDVAGLCDYLASA
jgi:hypothetical protein